MLIAKAKGNYKEAVRMANLARTRFYQLLKKHGIRVREEPLKTNKFVFYGQIVRYIRTIHHAHLIPTTNRFYITTLFY